MNKAFGHDYELYIGKASTLEEVHKAPTGYEEAIPALIKSPKTPKKSLITGGFIDYRTVPKKVYKIEPPFQVIAEVSYKDPKVSSSTPQVAKFRVYNLSDDTINFIKKDRIVIFNAGYETQDKLPMCFSGTVTKVDTERSGTDLITTIEAKEAGTLLNTVRWVKSFSKGVSYLDIFNAAIDKFKENGVSLGRINNSNPRVQQKLEEPLALSGKLSNVMDEVCEAIDYVWFITKGKLYIQPRDIARKIAVVNLSNSQIIDTIKPMSNTNGKSVENKEQSSGIKLKVFLNADIDLSTYIRIKEGDYKGDFKISKLTHNFNWKIGPCTTALELEDIKNYE